MWEILAWVGIVIVLILSGVAVYYLWQVRKLNKQSKKRAEELEAQKAAQKADLSKDICFIASAMQQGQCDITEGCIRIKHLLDAYDHTLQTLYPFDEIYQYYDLVKHMPILEQYKALSKQEQFKLDMERYRLEEQQAEIIKKAVTSIVAHPRMKTSG